MYLLQHEYHLFIKFAISLAKEAKGKDPLDRQSLDNTEHVEPNIYRHFTLPFVWAAF